MHFKHFSLATQLLLFLTLLTFTILCFRLNNTGQNLLNLTATLTLLFQL